MSEIAYVLTTKEATQWREVLSRCGTYDVYHLPGYHRVAEEQCGGSAVLFVFESGSIVIVMPLLIRRVQNLPGIETSTYFDATSVYGYPGPLSNTEKVSRRTIESFHKSLRDYLLAHNVVAVFSRLNPILGYEYLLEGFEGGEVVNVGPTVAIDLTLPPEEQWRRFRSNHRRDIQKCRRLGVRCVEDEDGQYLDTFIDLYYETMVYKSAAKPYFFERSYFARLREELQDNLHLFVAIRNGVVLSAALFTLCNGIIQYHLGGTDPRYRDVASSKLIFDAVRLWGYERGARVLHLGGGVGGKEDGVYRFKEGFSNLQYTFRTWRAVLDPPVYWELVKKRYPRSRGGQDIKKSGFFPLYRDPSL